MSFTLTKNALRDIFGEKKPEKPIVQVLKLKRVDVGRFRAQISDGEHMTALALFSTQAIDLIDNGDVEENAIIQLERYILNVVNETKKIIIILDASVVAKGQEVPGKIGEPDSIDGQLPISRRNGHASDAADAPAPLAAAVAEHPAQAPEKKQGVHPIAALTPYQNKWTICARVTSKTDVKTWNNSRGEGKLFSVNLLDSSGEIRATGFNQDCERLFNLFEENKLFYISGGVLKAANKRFSNLKNDYEINFHSGSTVSPCLEDSGIPMMQFDFITIEELEKVDPNGIVDIIGVCKSCADVSTIQSKKSGQDLKKRDLQLVDYNAEVRLTLWGSQAENFDAASNPIVAVKGVRVSDFGGRSLSVLSSSVMQINPDVTQAHKLRAWYDKDGAPSHIKNMSNASTGGGGAMGSNFKTLGEATLANIGSSGDAEYYSTKAAVNFIRQENCMYQACPGEGCNKKVVDLSNGMYKCEKCSKDYDTFKWRMLLSASLCDATDSMWVTFFQDQGETLLGCSSDHLAQLKESDSDAYSAIFQKAVFSEYIFKLRAKMDTYMDERRLKTTVVSISPLDPIEYTKFLLLDIEKMLN